MRMLAYENFGDSDPSLLLGATSTERDGIKNIGAGRISCHSNISGRTCLRSRLRLAAAMCQVEPPEAGEWLDGAAV